LNKFWTNLKGWGKALILALIAGAVLWFILNGMPYLNSYFNELRAGWEAKKLQNEWEKPYREDTFGGKTPEETYDMFLSALSKGDTTLASKYFVVDEQDKWEKTLTQYQEARVLNSFVTELKQTKTLWKQLPPSREPLLENTISYGYTTVVKNDSTADFNGKKIAIPAGNYSNSTTFELNTYTKIWKIRDL
jgi:hypothetical protein